MNLVKFSLKKFSSFLNSNPRKIKRITNISLLVLGIVEMIRQLDYEKKVLLIRKLVPWVILCEQWPVRMTWFLQIILDDWQNDYHVSWKDINLWEFYNIRVKPRYNDVELTHVPEPLRLRYQRLFPLDSDKDVFEKMMEQNIGKYNRDCCITVGDIGILGQRENDKLISYSINLNPALIEVLTEIPQLNLQLKSILSPISDFRKCDGSGPLM